MPRAFLGLAQVLTAAIAGNTVLPGLALGRAEAQAALRSADPHRVQLVVNGQASSARTKKAAVVPDGGPPKHVRWLTRNFDGCSIFRGVTRSWRT